MITYGQLFCRSGNIGDDVQAIAASRHLPKPAECFIDRDSLHLWPKDRKATVIMNGWFSANAAAWPPPASINPIFVGFHVTPKMQPAITRHADYLRSFGTIGTRDPATTDFLRSIGVAAETTYCLSLTLPVRTATPVDGKVYIVDAAEIALPRAIRAGAVKVTHSMPPLDYRVTLPAAQQLLALYRDTASLVVTTRLHAALPCIAMGIPVLYFADPSDGRANIVRDIGGIVLDRRLHLKSMARGLPGKLLSRVDWSPKPVDIASVKTRLIERVTGAIANGRFEG